MYLPVWIECLVDDVGAEGFGAIDKHANVGVARAACMSHQGKYNIEIEQ